jgi:hypothetical protein
MRGRAVHFLGVGDIVEPVEDWKAAKFEQTGRPWDYVFRRLFYAYTPDITQAPFCPWTELANLDPTAGHIRNGDIHLDADGAAHILWSATNIDLRLRDRFFSNERAIHSLQYMTLQAGKTTSHQTLCQISEDENGLQPELARFHILPDGTRMALASFSHQPAQPSASLLYRLAQLNDNEPDWLDIPLKWPLPGTFLTNTVRAGSPPSQYIDIVGTSPRTDTTLAYARIRLEIT